MHPVHTRRGVGGGAGHARVEEVHAVFFAVARPAHGCAPALLRSRIAHPPCCGCSAAQGGRVEWLLGGFYSTGLDCARLGLVLSQTGTENSQFYSLATNSPRFQAPRHLPYPHAAPEGAGEQVRGSAEGRGGARRAIAARATGAPTRPGPGRVVGVMVRRAASRARTQRGRAEGSRRVAAAAWHTAGAGRGAAACAGLDLRRCVCGGPQRDALPRCARRLPCLR